jgi:ubiquinone/menaquinone biosynthesis C-methylase UbiE
MRPMTERLFAEAGIAPGATVLDLGCGAGDVSMLVAQMVGPRGRVIGLDLDDAAVGHARARAVEAGFDNVSYVISDFARYRADAPLDAIVGRFVLMYQLDPSAALAPLVRQLRPGGIVAFIEPWFRPLPDAFPDCATKTAINCLIETLRRSGAQMELGPRLHRVFQDAGLPVPNLRFEAVMDGHEDSALYQYGAETLRSLLPKALEYGVAGADQLDIESLAERMAAEMKRFGLAMTVASSVCAWCRTRTGGASQRAERVAHAGLGNN